LKEALARSFLKVVVFSSLMLCPAVSLFISSSWSQSGSTVQDIKPSATFVPPALSYSSVFKDYHGYREQEVASWLDANATVERIGGWRYYLEEASQPHQPSGPLPVDADNHSGHGGKP